ncbi:hypothetical protein ACFQ1Q_02925 [Winogradskyella litorisediminis]|uniref:Uncharacterized protein n=1 Tax=Winogradskyella litorisediminis TaxID=1156618 RepID=A0ABW3N7H7_9FLAO
MNLKNILYSFLILIGVIIVLVYAKLATENTDQNVCEIQNISDLENINFKDFQFVKIKASDAYQSDALKDLLQGENYRKAWQTVVEVPILFLDTLYGGVEIEKIGGGKQTQSLKLLSNNGLMLTLRSVNKNPDALVPETLRKLKLDNIVKDGVSAQHPYAALPVAKLADAVGVIHTNPQLVFLPKQKILGNTYNSEFGNKLYLLEYENKGTINWSNYPNIEFVTDNDNLQELKATGDLKIDIDKRQLVKSRLFDIVIGDWDRHAKQWGWLMQKQDSSYNAIPFPMDRDNAFFNVQGLIPTIISSEEITPHLQSFHSDIDMEGLVYDFDVYFLQNTSLEMFLEEAKYIKKHLTDDVLENAFKTWNESLYNLDARTIIATIKTRRDRLVNIAINFKKTLDKQPLLNESLKGSLLKDTPGSSLKCFEC